MITAKNIVKSRSSENPKKDKTLQNTPREVIAKRKAKELNEINITKTSSYLEDLTIKGD